MDIDAELELVQSKIHMALDQIAKAGATGEVAAYEDQGLSVNVRKGEVDQVEFTRSHGFGVTVYRKGCKGSASTSDFSDAAVKKAVQAALEIAQFTAEDQCAGLAEAELMATNVPDLDLHHPWALSTEQAIDLAIETEAAGLQQEKISNSDGGSVGSGQSVRAYGNSHGLVVAYPSSRHAIGCALIAESEQGMERGGWSYGHCNPQELMNAKAIGEKAAQRAIQRLDSRSAPTGHFPVLFAPEIAGGLLGHFISAVSGGSLYRHASFLEGKLGEAVFPSWMSITEQPLLIQGTASSPIDGDGLATQNKSVVENGELLTYILGTYSARKLGMKSTANAGGMRNVRCSTTHSLDQLLKQMGTGLLATHVMGQGVNIVTGHYSRGAAGFWVENGEIQYPVSEVTVAANLKDIYSNLVGVGEDIDARGNIQVGSILVESMSVAGK